MAAGEVSSLGRFFCFEDDRRTFMINDDPMLGQAVFSASKVHRSQGLR